MPVKLAGYTKEGKPWVKKDLPPEPKRRILGHQKAFTKARSEGKSFTASRRIALDKEHEGMSKRQISVYEGKLGHIARGRRQ